MKTTNSLLVLIFAVGILSGCTSGLQFNHERIIDLDLHKIKKSEYVKIFGDPFKTSNMIVSGDKYQMVWYHFGLRAFLGNASVRNLVLEFKNDELNAYMYGSSFSSDKTRADISKLDNIKIGISTRDDVLSLLGKPYAKAYCPSQLADFKDNCTKAKEVWEWIAFELGYANKVIEKEYAIIMFEENGKVVDLKAGDIKF